MRQVVKAYASRSAVVALALAAPACLGTGNGDSKENAETGTIRAALTVGGTRHDVTAIHYKVVSATSSCSDAPLAETTSPLEEEDLPGSVLPPGAGPHAGADGLFVLPPGEYRVCATPLGANGPSQECALAQGTASVISESTIEIALVSQCGADASGGLDTVVTLNDPPKITGLTIAPSKFITQCETATITASASDPDGDAISYTWALLSGAGTLSGQGNAATFAPAGPGDATAKVTVTDANGGSASLSFPVHVSAATCASCSDGVQNQGETGVDCGGPCPACGGGGGSSSVFTFTDTSADDVSPTALRDFFVSLGLVSSSQYIMFEINAAGAGGAWCASNANFYIDNYLSTSGGGSILGSGSWDKYWRATGGAWSGPSNAGFTNYFGVNCDGSPFSWCSEWGLGNLFLGVMPGQSSSSDGAIGESYSDGWSFNGNWAVKIAVGADRLSTCGF